MKDWNDIVEVGLPPINVPLIATIKDNKYGYPNRLRYPVYYWKDTKKDRYICDWRYGGESHELETGTAEVIA